MLEAAKGAQATSSQMLTVARDSYVKSSDVLSQQQNKLSDIQTTLSNLTASNISMVSLPILLLWPKKQRFLTKGTGRDQAYPR